MKNPFPSKTTMLPLSITPDTPCKGLRTLAPWNVVRLVPLEMSLPPCRSVRTCTVSSPRLSTFHLQGPCIVVFLLCSLIVSKQHLANPPDTQQIFLHRSQLSSRYRPRLPSVSPCLLSIVKLRIVTPLIGVLARSVFSFSVDVILWRFSWQTLVHSQFLAHRTDKKVHREAAFHIGFRLRCVLCPRIHLLQSVELLLLPIRTVKEWILFVSVIFIARFQKLPAKRFC